MEDEAEDEKAQKYYIHWLLSLSVVVVVFQRDEN
jgi:hypothetical protein